MAGGIELSWTNPFPESPSAPTASTARSNFKSERPTVGFRFDEQVDRVLSDLDFRIPLTFFPRPPAE